MSLVAGVTGLHYHAWLPGHLLLYLGNNPKAFQSKARALHSCEGPAVTMPAAVRGGDPASHRRNSAVEIIGPK